MKPLPLAYLAALLPWYAGVIQAQSAPAAGDDASITLEAVRVEASADASAGGLAPAFAGG